MGCSSRRLGEFDVSVEQLAACCGEGVEDDLVLAPRAGKASAAQRAQVVADEVLGAAGDPCQGADAQLLALAQRERDQQPRRVCKRLRPRGRVFDEARLQALSDLLRARQVETEQLATILSHMVSLTQIAVSAYPARPQIGSAS